MKSNELMIGDWVMYNPNVFIEEDEYESYYKEPYPIKIRNVEDIDIAVEDCYSPIPITPEILEKNGFVNDSYYDECVADGKFIQVPIWTYREENILIDWDGYTLRVVNDFGHPCEEISLTDASVHELQHALKLCGIKHNIIL